MDTNGKRGWQGSARDFFVDAVTAFIVSHGQHHVGLQRSCLVVVRKPVQCVGFVRLERIMRGACGDEAYRSMLMACSAVPSGSSNGLNAKHTLSVLGACCSHTALRHGLASAGG